MKSKKALILGRYVVKSLGSKYDITPCFMAKPKEGLPGNSGHMHSKYSYLDPSGAHISTLFETKAKLKSYNLFSISR